MSDRYISTKEDGLLYPQDSFSKKLRKVVRSNAAYDFLEDGTWTAGGCQLLAKALERIVPESSVWMITANTVPQHAVLRVGDALIDADGVQSIRFVFDKMRLTEQVTGSMALVPYDENIWRRSDNAFCDERLVAGLASFLKKKLGPIKMPVRNPRGEWWIDDGGSTTFADGDIGDTNHVVVAFEAALGMSLEDSDAPEMIAMEPLSKEAIAWLREQGAPKEAIEYLKDGSDPRDYALEHMGWIRVADSSFQMWTFDDNTLDMIRGSDIWDEEGDDGKAIEESNDPVYIEELSQNKTFAVEARDIFDPTATAAKLKALSGGIDWREKTKAVVVARKGMSTDSAGPEGWQYRRIGDNPRPVKAKFETATEDYASVSDRGRTRMMSPDGIEMGSADWWYRADSRLFELEYICVSKKYRSIDNAVALMKYLAKIAKKLGARAIGGEVTWKGPLVAGIFAFGEPEYVGDDFKEYDWRTAYKMLPDVSPEKEDCGLIEGGFRLYVRSKL